MRIARLAEDDWETLRGLRLRAVTEDAEVFGSQLGREAGFQDRHWRMRLRSSAWFAAYVESTPAGLVDVMLEPGAAPDDRHVVALWVVPELRRAGLGTLLLEHACRWAAEDGGTTASSWLAQDDTRATSVYRKAGFLPTGTVMPRPREPSRLDERWGRAVVGP